MVRTYMFNVQTTIEVVASDEDEAYERLNDPDNAPIGTVDVTDRDVLLVFVGEVSRLRAEYEKVSA